MSYFREVRKGLAKGEGNFYVSWGGSEGVGEASADGVVVLAGGGVGVGVPFVLRGAFGAGGRTADLVGGEEAELRGDVAAQAYFSAVGEGRRSRRAQDESFSRFVRGMSKKMIIFAGFWAKMGLKCNKIALRGRFLGEARDDLRL